MKTILLATDFSAAASNAAEYAAEMAMAIKADLHALHVCTMPVGTGEMTAVISPEELIQGAEKEMLSVKEYLAKIVKGMVAIETEVKLGTFFVELEAVCNRVKPYVVVMGSQGTTAAERLLFGGHTVHAMKHLMWPLIAVPVDAKFAYIRRIGLASDLENVTEDIPLDEIKILVNDFNAELHVLNTGRQEEFNPEEVFASSQLEQMLKPLKPDFHFLGSRDIDEGIMNFADESHIDLLIVLPKRHNLLDKMLRGSHTKKLVLHSHVPVMALHHD